MSGKGDIHNDPNAGKGDFRTNPQNIGGGRKKKIYTILKEKGYSKDDIQTAFGELAFYTIKEISEVHDDETKPVIIRIVANQFYLALKKGDWTKIKEILEHSIGKPKQSIDHTTDGEKLDPPTFIFKKLNET